MEVTQIRGQDEADDAWPAPKGIGALGWCGLFAIFVVAVLLVACI